MASRALLLAGDQVFWECSEMQACEAFPSGFPDHVRTDHFKTLGGNNAPESRYQPHSADCLSCITSQTSTFDKLYACWCGIVRQYSAASLTKQSDRLIAISGLAKHFESALGDQYLAGLWKHDLLRGIGWRQTSGYRKAGYYAPSWSWASVDGAVSFHSISRGFLLHILDAHTNPRTIDETGDRIEGQLFVRAFLVRIRLERFPVKDCNSHKTSGPGDWNVRCETLSRPMTFDPQEGNCRIQVSPKPQAEDMDHTKYVCMTYGFRNRDKALRANGLNIQTHIECFLLKPVTGSLGNYVRWGMIKIALNHEATRLSEIFWQATYDPNIPCESFDYEAGYAVTIV